MKTLKELQVGDWVSFWRFRAHPKPPELGRVSQVTKVTDKRITAFQYQFKVENGYAVNNHSWVDYITPATPEEIADWQRRQDEHAAYIKQRKAYEARDEWQLANHIVGATNMLTSDQLSTMPIDRLRQIAAWLDEHAAQVKGTP